MTSGKGGMTISLIVAMAENRIIGCDNKMPWHLPEDLRYFKRVTMGKPVLMGRNTFESIGKPLPGRANIVITRNQEYHADGIVCVASVEQALALAAQLSDSTPDAEVMIIGGAQIYTQTLALAQRLYLTQVHAEIDGDAAFPAFERSQWLEVSREDHAPSENNPYSYSFLVLERKA